MKASDPLVLVVDDEPHMCNALRRILEKERYRVITALNGEAALELIKEKKPDVILLDIVMPGRDGREINRRVGELSPTTKIIYFIAKVEPTDPSKLKELRGEVDAFIAKPTTTKRITSTLSNMLNNEIEIFLNNIIPSDHFN